MGGSGSIWGSIDPATEIEKIRKAGESNLNAGVDTEVNSFLAKLLVGFNDRDVETINSILDEIKNDLKEVISDTIDILFGGSIHKNTYIEGLSDIDSLICLDNHIFKDKSPNEVKNILKVEMEKKFGKENVKVGNLAVTINTKGYEIQLLPAIKEHDTIKISSFDGNNWSRINPKNFTDILTKVNKRNNGNVIPVIKLVKSIISSLPEQQQLSGYHIESLAVNIFKDYDNIKTYKEMVKHFFISAVKEVKEPIYDKSGQSLFVDDYLGPSNSIKRRLISISLDRIARKIRNLDGLDNGNLVLDTWSRLLNHE